MTRRYSNDPHGAPFPEAERLSASDIQTGEHYKIHRATSYECLDDVSLMPSGAARGTTRANGELLQGQAEEGGLGEGGATEEYG